MPGDAIGDCGCGQLRIAARRVTRFYDRHLAPSGLRTTQFSVLAMIHEACEISVKELASRLALDRTTMGQNLKPLERDGLLVVTRSQLDQRVRSICLTAAGAAAVTRAFPLWAEARKSFERLNSAETLATLEAILKGLRFGE